MRDAVGYLTVYALALFGVVTLIYYVQNHRRTLNPFRRMCLRSWQTISCLTAVAGTMVLAVWSYWP